MSNTIHRGADLRVRKTDRYRLAEALAGVPGRDDRWRLNWSARHLLLLAATPHARMRRERVMSA